MIIRLPVQNYLISRLYGPGMPVCGVEGLIKNLVELELEQVGLVLVHCWNLGESDGPYPHEPGVSETGEAGDWVIRAHEIIRNRLSPALSAARKAGVKVFHLAQYVYADRYARYREIAADPSLQGSPQREPESVCLQPETVDQMFRDQYGTDFPGAVWITDADKFDIARAVKPAPGEDVYLNGSQLNGLCRRYGIDTLNPHTQYRYGLISVLLQLNPT